jgi:Holliday junction resolvase RusA-like endonuclease
MDPIEIKILGNPSTRTAQQKGVTIIHGHVHHYEKKEVKLAKEAFMYQLVPYAPEFPIEGPVKIFIEWRFGLKKCRKVEWKTTRPDLDNLEKSCLDCLSACQFWKDDSQVVVKTSVKTQAPDGDGYLYIRIEQMEDEP